MRCPKCHYISFDSSDRCRNCGYEFSLAVEAAPLDLPIQTGEEPVGPLADFELSDDSGSQAASPAGTPPSRAPAAERRSHTPTELPLFGERRLDDDAPLVNPGATPRAPLAVRRSTPAAPRVSRSATGDTPANLELPIATSRTRTEVAGSAGDADRLESGVPAAGLVSRTIAGVIDLAILGGINAAVVYFTLKICGFTFEELPLLPRIPLIAFLSLLNGGYLVAFVAAAGQTIGKMLTGIRVVPGEAEHAGARVPLGTAFARAAATVVSLAPAGAGLLLALFAPDRRTLHDRLAHTRVVKA